MNIEPPNETNPSNAPRTEEALRASELRYRRLFESAQDGILILDFDTGRVTDVNPFLVELLGFSHDEMVGQTVGELSPFKDIVSNQVVFARLKKEGYVRYEDLPLETKDSRKIAVEFVSNVYEAGGKKVIQCNIRDITERKRRAEELLWKTTLLEAQLESSIDGVLVVDDSGTQLLQNRRMTEIWKNPQQIVATGDEAAQVAFATNQIKNPGQFLEKINYLNTHPDAVGHDEVELANGTVLDRYSAPVRNRAGKCYGRIWSFRDITERRKLDARVQQAQKMESIGQMAGGIAHDFNNILTAIVGHTDLMKLEGAASPNAPHHLDQISKASRRATDLVRQIMIFSRQTRQEREPLHLNDVVIEALQLLRASVPSTFRIQTELTEAPTVLANATSVHQMIMNLGTNAWHAMRDHPGTIRVETRTMEVDAEFARIHPELRPGRYVRLTVADTGSGMDRATMDRMFDPFFTTKGVGEGTGLGLAVVHGIMKSHEGGISVHSHPGEGTTFHLYFPAIGTEAAKVEKDARPIPRGHGERILFVDDEESLATLGKKVLERLGYAVTPKTNSPEALAAIRAHPDEYSLVVTDLSMPDMDGVELGAQIQRVHPRLPMILTSGSSGIMTVKKVRELGFRELLEKPTTARSLGESVHRVLANEKSSAGEPRRRPGADP